MNIPTDIIEAQNEIMQLRAILAERDREISRLHTKLKVDVTQQLNEKADLRAQLAEAQSKLKRIEDAAHADAADLEKMRDGTKLTRAGVVQALAFMQEELAETQEKLKEAENRESEPDLTLIEEVREFVRLVIALPTGQTVDSKQLAVVALGMDLFARLNSKTNPTK